MGRKPCATCPWKRSTPPNGFPGGKIRLSLLHMITGSSLRVMGCHSSSEGIEMACAGYVRQYPDVAGVRIARVLGAIQPGEIDVSDLTELRSLEELIQDHGT
jgi:hypothetical protein